MPVDIIFCDNGHEFCKECVQRAAEVEIGQGKLDFPCLQNCEAKFSLQVLQVGICFQASRRPVNVFRFSDGFETERVFPDGAAETAGGNQSGGHRGPGHVSVLRFRYDSRSGR